MDIGDVLHAALVARDRLNDVDGQHLQLRVLGIEQEEQQFEMTDAQGFDRRVVLDRVEQSLHGQFGVFHTIDFAVFGDHEIAVFGRVQELSLGPDETEQILRELSRVLQRELRLFVVDADEDITDHELFLKETVREV